VRALQCALKALPLTGLALLGVAAAAQPPEQEATAERETETPADRFGFVDGAQLQVTTGTDEGNLTFRAALPAGPSQASRFSLSASTPLQGDEEAMPASLDALANGTRVTVSWGYFDVNVVRPDASIRQLRDEAKQLCRLREPIATRSRCRDSAFAIARHAPENMNLDRRATTRAATDFGVEATVGFNDFEWLDRVAGLPREERRTDWSVAGHVARYLATSHTALTASVSYQRAFKAADEERVCPAGTTDPEAECPNVRTAGPARDENLLMSVGLRHRFFGGDRLSNLAIAPIVTYDVIDDVVGVDVPIYYTPDDEGGLNGGIRFGYRTDRDNKFSVAFFVGTTFDIFGGR
jgi:hypothetical protein